MVLSIGYLIGVECIVEPKASSILKVELFAEWERTTASHPFCFGQGRRGIVLVPTFDSVLQSNNPHNMAPVACTCSEFYFR